MSNKKSLLRDYFQIKPHDPKKEFSDLLSRIRPFYENLKITDEQINHFDDLAYQMKVKDDTYTHLEAFGIILIFLIVGVSFFNPLVSFSASTTKIFFSYFEAKKNFIEIGSSAFYLYISAGLAFYISFIYPYFNKLDSFIRKFSGSKISSILSKRKFKSENIDTSLFRFRLFQFGTIFACTLAILQFFHFKFPSVTFFGTVVTAIFLLCICVTCFILIGITYIEVLLLITKRNAQDTYISTVLSILMLLFMIRDLEKNSDFNVNTRNEVMFQINRISNNLLNIFERTEENFGNTLLWSNRRIENISKNFHSLISWVSFSKSDSLPQLKIMLVNYLHILVRGDLDELPHRFDNDELIFVQKPKLITLLNKTMDSVWLLFLIFSPILVMLLLETNFKIAISNLLQTPLYIVYGIWVAMCLFSHLQNMPPDSKNSFMELVKVFKR